MDDFALNLRLCCSYFPSISAVCRRLDLNRQQFNKYISGANRPSRHNQGRLCTLFGLDENELYLPHDEFRQIFVARRQLRPPSGIPDSITSRFSQVFASGVRPLRSYHGFYFKYFGSMTDPGMVKRDLCHVFSHRGFTISRTKEKSSPSHLQANRLLSYNGLLTVQAERIFWIEFDRLWNREVSFNILFPSPIHEISILEGMIMGTALNKTRDVIAAKVVMHYLGQKIDKRSAMSQIGLLPLNDPTIPDPVRESLANVHLRDLIFVSPA